MLDVSSEVLESLKHGGAAADENFVNEGFGARPRLDRNPTTDSGGDGAPRHADDDGFAFNLGTALSKLGLDPHDPVAERASASPQPIPEPAVRHSDALAPMQRREPADAPTTMLGEALAGLPMRGRPQPASAPASAPAPAPTAAPTPAPVFADDPLPRRGVDVAPAADLPARAPAAPAMTPHRHDPVEPQRAPDDVVAEPVSRSYVAPRRSVFDDVVSPSPQLPPTVVSPPVAPAPPPPPPPRGATRRAIVSPATPAVAAPPVPVAPAPVLPGAGAPLLPTLPAAAPVASPVITPQIDNTPSQVDIRALRSAQIRASRQNNTGRVVVRTFLVLLVLGGLIGAAMMFGRDLLFPTNWDPTLTPIVDEIERSRGEPFGHTVGLVRQTQAEFDGSVVRLTIGDEWTARVPEWRALGLATGDPTPESIAAAARDSRVAIYDPATDRIYMPDTATPEAAEVDLRVALERAFDAQLGATTVAEPVTGSLAGISPTPVIARRAVDRFLVGDAATPATWQPTEGVPAPIEYELLASRVLGESLLDAAGVDPAATTFGTDLSTALAAILDDAPRPAEAGALQVGERSLAEPIALGNDDWSLVWGTRLPAETVGQLTTIIRGDSYRAIDRNGVTCVVGAFETATAPEADIVLAAATAWVGASPLESQATATRLSETRVQLVTCDPGATVAPAPNPQAVVALIDRQLARLAAL